MGLTTAMQELIDAVKAGDAGAAASAFKSAVSLCSTGYEE
jgi:ribosomal protein S20